MQNLRLILIASAATLAALTGSAVAQDAGGAASTGDDFQVWDTNTDANIDTDEWNVGFSSLRLFERWDEDGDDQISQQEFDNRAAIGGDPAAETSGTSQGGEPAETSATGQAEEPTSFSARFKDASFDSWDTNSDGSISPMEFAENVRMGYDVSGDNRIDRNEWVEFERDRGPGGMWVEQA